MEFQVLYEGYFKLLALFPRALVAVLMVPVFARRLLPGAARHGVALSLVVVAVSGVSGEVALLELPGGTVMFLILKEAVIGFALGLSFGLVFWVGQMVGELIDHQTGLTFSQNIDPAYGNQVSTTGAFLYQVFTVYLLSAGALLVFADALLLSYELWPVQAPLPNFAERVVPLLALESSRLFALALLLAAPALLVVYLIDFGFGFLGRAAPQLNIFFLTMAFKGFIALFVLMISLPYLLSRTWEVLLMVRSALVDLMRATGG